MIINPLLYLTFLAFSFGQLGRISLLNQQINFYLYELVMGISLLAAFFRFGFKPIGKSFKKGRLVYIFSVYLLFIWFLGVPNHDWQQNSVALLYQLRLLFYWLYFLYIFKFIRVKHLMVFILLTIISSLLQFFLYPDLRNLIYLGWDPHYNRLFGVFFDTAVAGAVYGLLFLYLLMANPNSLLLLTYLAFIVLTYSRSLYGVFSITIFHYFISRGLVKLFISIILIFLTLLLFIPTDFGKGVGLNRVFSVKSRLNDYREAVMTWSKSPLVGIGYNRIRRPSTTHAGASYSSSYLIILVAGGVIGLGFFLTLLYRLSRLNRKAGYYVLFIALLSLTDNILLHPFVMFLSGSILLVGDGDRL